MSTLLKTQRIWNLDDSRRADPTLPADADLRGEIHPDLIRYKGHWYCGLREPPLNRARVIRSADGVRWDSVRLLTWESGLIGDLKFSVTAEGALMITTFVKALDLRSSARKPPRLWTASVTWLSHDGVDWGNVHACPTGFASPWIVRYETTWCRGAGYSVATITGDLYKTLDGKSWRLIQPNIWSTWRPPSVDAKRLHSIDHLDINAAPGDPPKPPSETALAFDPIDAKACALVRAHPHYAIIGTADAPDYSNWTWKPAMVDWDGDGKLQPAHERLGVQIGGPKLKYLANGLLLAAGRYDASPADAPGSVGPLALFIVDRDRGVLRRWVDLREHGLGRQYPGVVEHDDKLWVVTGLVHAGAPFELHLIQLPLPE
jgi:hypothetical protein